jgi:hypothetical protein
MVNVQDVVEWDKLDNAQMKMLLMAYKTENMQMKMKIDTLTMERNALMERIAGVRLVGSFKGVPSGLDGAGVVQPPVSRPRPSPPQ